jgi:hypothetical protein
VQLIDFKRDSGFLRQRWQMPGVTPLCQLPSPRGLAGADLQRTAALTAQKIIVNQGLVINALSWHQACISP